jgi:hypothetical protein
MMNQAILAQARRFYHHVYHGGQLKPEDVSYMVSALEEAYNNILTDEEQALFEKLKKVWFHTQPDKSGSFFICGDGGEKDDYGLPDIILVCPRMGDNTTAIYRKEKVGRSGQ